MSKALKKLIENEKNVQVRERHEHIMRRNYNVFLVLFLGGGILVGRHIFTMQEGLFLAMLFLAFYGFLESVQAQYQQYTDELIRGAGKATKSKKK